MGVHKVRRTLSGGRIAVYYYAWRGGPRIHAEPDTRAFLAEYVRLTQGRADAIPTGTLAELVFGFQRSTDFLNLRERTRRDYEDHFKHVLAYWADFPIAALEEIGVRAEIKQWHESMAETPRRADMRLAALSRVLSWALDRELIQINKALGIKKLCDGSRRDVIWTPEHLNTFIEQAPKQLAWAVMLALYTGQRLGDLLVMPWSAWDGEIIALKQRKTGRRVRIRVDAELAKLLSGIPRVAVTILTTSAGTSWTEDGFGGFFRKWAKKLGIEGVTFNDLRGTYITLAYSKGHSIRDISDASGHSEKHCERIIRDHYLAADLVENVNEYRIKM